MTFGRQFAARMERSTLLTVAALAFVIVLMASARAQVNGGPPSVTSIPNHVGAFLPNPRPSITSLGPQNFGRNYGFNNCRGDCRRRDRGAYGAGYGFGYALPYYYLYDAYDPGYDSGSSPYMYSGPPNGPRDQTLHIIVEQAPTKRPAPADDESGEPVANKRPPDAPAVPDLRPVAATVLVFRDGHRQDVNNYAIMGQTLYVFDDKTRKIAIAELDVAATVKANEDQGVEFLVPQQAPSKLKKDSAVPRSNVPENNTATPNNLATAIP